MTDDTPSRKSASERDREDRLAAALRANLARRKAQARARVAEDGADKDKAGDGPEGNL
jgi:hypothetical protein